MGWPPCMAEGCDRWPSVGFTGVCSACIQDPKKVTSVAEEMSSSLARFTAGKDADLNRVAWLTREPDGKCFRMVLDVIDFGEKDLRKAIDRAREHYWATLPKSEENG